MSEVTISDVKLFPVNNHKTVKANGEFVVNGSFKIKFTLMQGSKGLFVGLPGDYYSDKNTGEKKWSSKVECIDEAVTKQLQKAILDAYNKRTGNKSAVDQGKSQVGSDDQANIPF